jgi:hypothetical protein
MRSTRCASGTPKVNRARHPARLGWVVVTFCGAPAALGAQTWQSNIYPYAYYSAIDGWWAGVHGGMTDPDASERSAPYGAALGVDASASTAGSYAFIASARAPAYWPHWRAAITLTAACDNRLGFYGLGNDTPFAAESVTAAAPYFYRVSRAHASARATLERQIAGPVRVLLGAGLEQTEFRALAGPSVFANDMAAGVSGVSGSGFTDRTLRGGVAFDTRDDERDPHAGVFLQGLFAAGTGYTRTSASAQIYAHPAARLVLAGRVAGEGMGGTPPLASEVTMDAGDQDFIVVGGYESLRGY